MELQIHKKRLGWCNQWEVSGFTDRELDELKSMEYRDLTDKMVELLDDQMDGLGTYLTNCIGIHGVQFGGDKVLIKTNV